MANHFVLLLCVYILFKALADNRFPLVLRTKSTNITDKQVQLKPILGIYLSYNL